MSNKKPKGFLNPYEKPTSSLIYFCPYCNAQFRSEENAIIHSKHELE